MEVSKPLPKRNLSPILHDVPLGCANICLFQLPVSLKMNIEEFKTDFSPRVNEYTFPDPIERSRLLNLAKALQDVLQGLKLKWDKLLREQLVLEICVRECWKKDWKDSEKRRLDTDMREASNALFHMDYKIQPAIRDLQRLENPHPISRCNIDILQYIFEVCVYDSQKGRR